MHVPHRFTQNTEDRCENYDSKFNENCEIKNYAIGRVKASCDLMTDVNAQKLGNRKIYGLKSPVTKTPNRGKYIDSAHK